MPVAIFRYCVCALVLLFAVPSHAGFMAFNFEYVFSDGETLSGMLEGDLRPDNETVTVSRITMFAYSGDPGLTFEGPIERDTATASGNSLFLIGGINMDPGNPEGIWSLNGGVRAVPPTGAVPAPAPSPGNLATGETPPNLVFEIFDHETWHLAPNPVPLPGGLPLLGISLLALAGMKRRKHQIDVH